MTRKHFKAIAETFARCLSYAEGPSEITAVKRTAIHMAGTLAQFNPNFDKGRFLEACGVES